MKDGSNRGSEKGEEKPQATSRSPTAQATTLTGFFFEAVVFALAFVVAAAALGQ
jgi:hypothetical protein